MKEKFLKQEFSYDGSTVGFRVDQVLLPNRKKAQREYLDHPGAVAILPFLDPLRKVGLDCARVVMVEQYRYPVGRMTLELPAGKLDGKEPLLRCLARELKEETGFSSKKYKKLISYWPTPAFANEVIHIYWTDSLASGKSHPDEDEFLRVKIETFGNLLKKVRQGKIRDSKTVIAILAFFQFFKFST